MITVLTVTPIAKEKLRETLQSLAINPDMAFRIIASPSMPDHFELILDKERKGDQIIQDENGMRILLVESNLVSNLERVVVNYQGKTPKTAGFTISRSASSKLTKEKREDHPIA